MALSTANFMPGVYELKYADGTTSRVTVTAAQLQTAMNLYTTRTTAKNGSGSKLVSLRWVSK